MVPHCWRSLRRGFIWLDGEVKAGAAVAVRARAETVARRVEARILAFVVFVGSCLVGAGEWAMKAAYKTSVGIGEEVLVCIK